MKLKTDQEFVEYWRRDLASKDARKDNVEGIELKVFYEALSRLESKNKWIKEYQFQFTALLEALDRKEYKTR